MGKGEREEDGKWQGREVEGMEREEEKEGSKPEKPQRPTALQTTDASQQNNAESMQ